MCVVSMVSDYYQQQYPKPEQWNKPLFHDYLELKRKAELYDQLTKQPDCQKPELVLFEQQIKDFLEKTYGLTPIK